MNLDSLPDFSLLPPHIITHILQYLKYCDLQHASSVCKSWHYASTDPQIVRTLLLKCNDKNFPEIGKSRLRYGILKLKWLQFDKIDSLYFELFEKVCPFVTKLYISDSDLKIHHLLKLLELVPRLELFSLSRCTQLEQLPGLFPPDYDCEAKNRIIKNLSCIKNISIERFKNIPFIADLLRHATNLNTFSNYFCEQRKDYFTIFDNINTGTLTHLKLNLTFACFAEHFITEFLKIKNLNLKSCNIDFCWIWRNYDSSLYRQFILKLQSLVEFDACALHKDQLSIVCRYLVNLKSLDCYMDINQPISELGNLKQLEKLHCSFQNNHDTHVKSVESDKFFKCKFDNLRSFIYEDVVTESNLVQLCQNHSNLIKLKLTKLLTPNLEIIFKYLTKLRYLHINFGTSREWLKPGEIYKRLSDQEYEYKISRLQDLESFLLSDLVNGIREDDAKQLKKLKSTNLWSLFSVEASDKPIFPSKCFGFAQLSPEITDSIKEGSVSDSEYKLSRLHELEEFYLSELVNGIRKEDVRQLKKLRKTNLPELFADNEIVEKCN